MHRSIYENKRLLMNPSLSALRKQSWLFEFINRENDKFVILI